MHVFYHPQQAEAGDSIILGKEESQHCSKVLRHQAGDIVFVVNGMGSRYECQIKEANPAQTKLLVINAEVQTRSYHIHIAIAPTKQPERIEWFLEKACELGVDEVTFLECDHSVRTKVNLERLEKITVSALKQSKTFFKAHLNGLGTIKDFISTETKSAKYIAIAAQATQDHLVKKIKPKTSYLLLIGPEGDFSEAEIKKALASGFAPVSLGESVLRTETAGLIGCHIFHMANV